MYKLFGVGHVQSRVAQKYPRNKLSISVLIDGLSLQLIFGL
jgi:hypothetical protein